MANIVYSYYTDSDAEAVAALFRRSGFGMGKYDPQLTAETFTQNQRKKGMIYAVVGKAGELAVSYVACYAVGGQRVCAPGQLIIGIILIDKAYRSAMFSISELFRLLMARAGELGYRVMISEVAVSNTASLMLNRKTGAILLNDKPTIHGDLVLYNYLPALTHHVCTDDILETNVMPSLLTHIRKKEMFSTVALDHKGRLPMDYKANGCQYHFLLEYATSLVVSSKVDGVFSVQQELTNRRILHYRAECAEAAQLTVHYVDADGQKNTQQIPCLVGEEQILTAPEGCDHVLLEIPEQLCIYRFDVVVPKPNASTCLQIGNFSLWQDSGYLSCGGKNDLCVLWPCFTYPYLEGALVPNRHKALQIAVENACTVTAQAVVDGMKIVCRFFAVTLDEMQISTRVWNPEGKALDPLFHFGFGLEQKSCTFCLADGTEYTKARDDSEWMYPELPYNDYQALPYSQQPFSQILVQASTQSYAITTESPAHGFFHRNYLRLYLQSRQDGDWQIFDSITIRRLPIE